MTTRIPVLFRVYLENFAAFYQKFRFFPSSTTEVSLPIFLLFYCYVLYTTIPVLRDYYAKRTLTCQSRNKNPSHPTAASCTLTHSTGTIGRSDSQVPKRAKDKSNNGSTASVNPSVAPMKSIQCHRHRPELGESTTYLRLECTAKCVLKYHQLCWKSLLDSQVICLLPHFNR